MAELEYYPVTIENVSLSNVGFIIFLKRAGDERMLPIFIGAAEAHSIAAALNQQDFPRPLSHDLFKNILSELGAEVTRIYVTQLMEGTFFARIFLRHQEREIEMDSRPSDAIALALRYRSPIFVHRDVFEEAAVHLKPEEGLPEGGKQEDNPSAKLQQEMEKAVVEERYEDAARFRDELKKLKTDN